MEDKQYVWVLVIDKNGEDTVYVCDNLDIAKECSRGEMLEDLQLAYEMGEVNEDEYESYIDEIDEKFERIARWQGEDGEGTTHSPVTGDCHLFTRKLVMKQG